MSDGSTPDDPRPGWRRLLPSTARTQIIAWLLLLVLCSLGVVTFVTWRLLVRAADERMNEALRVEVQEFNELTEPGVNPRSRLAGVGRRMDVDAVGSRNNAGSSLADGLEERSCMSRRSFNGEP